MTEFMKDCLKSIGVVFLYVFVVLSIMYASVSKGDLYGSSASFLLMDTHGMSLSYLSSNVDDAWRKRMEDSLLANGDSHIYLYSQNEADDVGGVSPKPDWEARINHLNSRGLRPVMWLMADDSPSLAALPLSKHKSHNAEIVKRFDSSVDGYVIGLEVDEYWTAAQTNEMILDLKKHTNKPIGVHLTPSTPLAYVTHADVLYLQTGFGLSQEQFREKVKATLSATSKPVIVSEYHLNSASLEAKALGDIACQLGAVGTGNGRNVTPCGQRETIVKKKWYKKYEKEMVGAGVALATLYVASRYSLPLTMTATEETYKIGLRKPIGNHTVGIDYGNQRSMLIYSVRF
tara:strand:- start:681 stop:1715 length:1035 start_codon:yes stop_codon:yes gene_type:complete